MKRIVHRMKNSEHDLKPFKILSDKELQEVNGGMSWWQAIEGVISNFQSIPAWVKGNVKPSGYIPGGGLWIGSPGMETRKIRR